MVEERINNSSSTGRPSTGDMRELYLGLLYPTEDFKVYPLSNQIRFFLLSLIALLVPHEDVCLRWYKPLNNFLFTGLLGLKSVFFL